jgi:hypothetical protein
MDEIDSDFVVNARELHYYAEAAAFYIHGRCYSLGDLAHRQIAEHCRLTFADYERMRAEAPQRLDEMVNAAFCSQPGYVLVRSMDRKAYAIVPLQESAVDRRLKRG